MTSVDDYLSHQPEAVRAVLERLRSTIHRSVPDVELAETIAYGMPTFRAHGRNLVHIAGWAHHVGLYPTPAGIAEFAAELAPYPQSKGAVRFPLDQLVPYDLVGRITRHRLAQETAKLTPGKRPLPRLSAPATRALTAAGITTLGPLAKRRRADIAELHGVGPSALAALDDALDDAGLSYKQ